MSRPVIAYHVILCNYGFWLPNDPRGSWSRFVRAPNIARHGPATTVTTHRSLAGVAHDRAARLAAKRDMVRPAVEFTGQQASLVYRGKSGASDVLKWLTDGASSAQKQK